MPVWSIQNSKVQRTHVGTLMYSGMDYTFPVLLHFNVCVRARARACVCVCDPYWFPAVKWLHVPVIVQWWSTENVSLFSEDEILTYAVGYCFFCGEYLIVLLWNFDLQSLALHYVLL
jgi:hypothetical protein